MRTVVKNIAGEQFLQGRYMLSIVTLARPTTRRDGDSLSEELEHAASHLRTAYADLHQPIRLHADTRIDAIRLTHWWLRRTCDLARQLDTVLTDEYAPAQADTALPCQCR